MHTALGEPCCSAFPNPCRGDSFLVIEDFGVHESGPVIERGVNEPIPDLAGDSVLTGVSTATRSVTATIRNRSDLFDVHMDQIAR